MVQNGQLIEGLQRDLKKEKRRTDVGYTEKWLRDKNEMNKKLLEKEMAKIEEQLNKERAKMNNKVTVLQQQVDKSKDLLKEEKQTRWLLQEECNKKVEEETCKVAQVRAELNQVKHQVTVEFEKMKRKAASDLETAKEKAQEELTTKLAEQRQDYLSKAKSKKKEWESEGKLLPATRATVTQDPIL